MPLEEVQTVVGRSEGSWASSPAARATMIANRRRDTVPELLVRRGLHAAGYRFRVDHPLIIDRRRRGDIVLTRRRAAVFIDGCFWHGCPQHHVPPRSNPEYWRSKVAANRARDRDTDARLIAAGWTVHRHWEHEDPAVVIDALIGGLGPPRIVDAARGVR
jgi:DNA mismatch endonuclease (patch repair protein)